MFTRFVEYLIHKVMVLIRKDFILLLVCFITFFVNNKVIEPDIMESRNIVTAREMVRDGHWIVPTMNGDLRLEKPPLPTWISALSEMVFPDSIAAHRAMAGVAALILVFFFYKYAKRILKIDPLIPTLVLCTCYNVVLMGRTATWDIYCHAFMMGAIYYLARALLESKCNWRLFLLSGFWMGLSIMSKGPVSLYALLLPFLISFFLCNRITMRGKWLGLISMAILALAIGGWWYLYIHVFHSDALIAVVGKESGSWFNRNVRPWYYYWQFFLESGIWSLVLLTSIFLPLRSKSEIGDIKYAMPVLWLVASLVLLSLLPEKKTRYLLPILISASYLIGGLIEKWKFRMHYGKALRSDVLLYRINTFLIGIVLLLLPVAAHIFLYSKQYISTGMFVFISAISVVFAILMFVAAIKKRPMMMLWTVVSLFIVAECFILPSLSSIINNPDMKSISAVRNIKELESIPFYCDKNEMVRIEIVYAADRVIRPLDFTQDDSVLSKLPCALVTHSDVAEILSKNVLDRIEVVKIGRYDDNHRPKGTKWYGDNFIYNVTLLKKK